MSYNTKLFLLAAFLAAAFFFRAEYAGAEFRLEPGILVSEEYNDNIFLQTLPRNRETDYITRFVPSIHLLYHVPLWDWDLNYAYDYRRYAKFKIDQNDAHLISLVNHTRILSETLFLDVQDIFRRVSLDPARDYTVESFFANQSDTNVFTVNPYAVLKLSQRDAVKAGYLYTNTWYRDPRAVNKADNAGFVELAHELTSRMSMTTGVKVMRDENHPKSGITTAATQNFTKSDVYAGGFYEYQEGAVIFATLGNSWFDFQKNGKTSQFFWNAGFLYKLPTISFSFVTALKYNDDPRDVLIREDSYVATIKKETERTLLSVSGGFLEYRSAETKHLHNSTYQLRGSISHAFTTSLRITGDLILERLEDNRADTYTSRYLPGVRFEYQALENLTLALDYRYTNVYSPDNYYGSYYNNRISAEIVKRF